MAVSDDKGSYPDSGPFAPRGQIALRYCDAIKEHPLDADDELRPFLHAEFTDPERVEMGR